MTLSISVDISYSHHSGVSIVTRHWAHNHNWVVKSTLYVHGVPFLTISLVSGVFSEPNGGSALDWLREHKLSEICIIKGHPLYLVNFERPLGHSINAFGGSENLEDVITLLEFLAEVQRFLAILDDTNGLAIDHRDTSILIVATFLFEAPFGSTISVRDHNFVVESKVYIYMTAKVTIGFIVKQVKSFFDVMLTPVVLLCVDRVLESTEFRIDT